jgi:glycosyltransferase 2 family protein
MKKLRSVIQILFFLSIGIGVVVVFWMRMPDAEKEKFVTSLSEANYFFLILSMLFGVIANYFRALRWGLLLDVFNFKPRKANLFMGIMNMYFFNLLVPRLGEVTRCGVLKQYEQVPMDKSLGSVVAERAVDMLVLLLIMGLAYVLQWDKVPEMIESLIRLGDSQPKPAASEGGKFPWTAIIGGSVALLGTLTYLLRNHPKFGKLWKMVKSLALGFWAGLRSVLKIKEKGKFTLYTAGIWFFYLAMTYVCFYAIPGMKGNALGTLTIMAAGSVAIILIPGGVGLFPIVVASSLSHAHMGAIPNGTGLALGWLMWGAQIAMILIVGSLSFILLPIINKKKTN